MRYITARRITAAPILLLLLGLLPAHALDLDDYRLVDLTHPFNKDTIYWPTDPSQFELKPLAYGYTEGGYFYVASTGAAPGREGCSSTGSFSRQ
jgi:hypothetical protein